MATVVAGVSAANTGNNTTLTTGAFTPAAADLLVAFAYVTGQASGGTFTDSQSLTWTQVTTAANTTNTATLVLAISNALAANSSMTVTFTPAGAPTATGICISVLRVSGMKRTGVTAIRQAGPPVSLPTQQIGKEESQGARTPAPSLPFAALTTNPVVGAVGNASNTAGLSPTTSGGTFSEAHDVGYNNPSTGLETQFISSGFTGTTVTWGSGSATTFSDIVAELDSSAPVVDEDAPVLGKWPDATSVGVYC
jgi:hypothetical protein